MNVIFVLSLLPLLVHSYPYAQKKVCLTPGCVKAAAILINNIDTHIDPCDDFYDYACGKYNAEAIIPDHKSGVGAFDTTMDTLNQNLKSLFEKESKSEELDIFKSVRNMYNTCMNMSSIDANSKSDLQEILGKLGGWPVLGDSFNTETFKWYKLMGDINRIGINANSLVSISIVTDNDDSTKRVLEIDQAQLGLEREYLVKGKDTKEVQAYYRYMVEAARYLGANLQEAQSQMQEVLDFEIKLAGFTLKREDRRNETALNNKMKLSEMNFLYELDWVTVINDMLENPVNENRVDESEVVKLATPKFIKDLKMLIDATDSQVIGNYMIWRAVKDSFPYLDEEARIIQQRYKQVIKGTKQQAPRWETCVEEVAGFSNSLLYFQEGSLSNAIGSMYARTYFPLENKKIVDEIEQNIRSEFGIIVDESDWMDKETRIKAHQKADMINSYMAYAEEILDDNLINQFYQDLQLKDSSYLKNYLTLKRFINKYSVQGFREKVDKESWKTHGGAAIVNAFYNPEENSIIFPAGFLSGVFFQADRPAYMNYGTIGLVIGHEITHGFDDQGSQKDGEGNLINWWSPVSKKQYDQKTQCIIDQYSNFTQIIDGEIMNVNGVNTQGENVADNGGLKQAIRAYGRMTEKYGVEPTLPGLPYTQDQLFWLSSASIWCSKKRPAKMKNQVLTDPHSPSRFRINGPFKNRPEFARAWNCPKGSAMNPVKKCEVW